MQRAWNMIESETPMNSWQIYFLLRNHNALESTNEGGFDHVSRPRQSQIELGLVHVFVANEYRFAPSIEHTRRKNKK